MPAIPPGAIVGAMDTFTIADKERAFEVWKTGPTAKASFVHSFTTKNEAEAFVANRRRLEQECPQTEGGTV